jgi:hypothetical protein
MDKKNPRVTLHVQPTSRKLVLRTERLRRLSTGELARIAAGFAPGETKDCASVQANSIATSPTITKLEE